MIRAEFPSVWKDYNNRRRVKRLVARLFWMAVGGGLALATLPYFPPAWAGWVGDRQDDITQRVNWGEIPQRSVVIPNDGLVQIKVEDPENARRGDLIEFEGDEWVLLGQWDGTESDRIDFGSGVSPWILAWSITERSSIATDFKVWFVSGEAADAADIQRAGGNVMGAALYEYVFFPGEGPEGTLTVPDADNGRIMVESVGADWTVMALREP